MACTTAGRSPGAVPAPAPRVIVRLRPWYGSKAAVPVHRARAPPGPARRARVCRAGSGMGRPGGMAALLLLCAAASVGATTYNAQLGNMPSVAPVHHGQTAMHLYYLQDFADIWAQYPDAVCNDGSTGAGPCRVRHRCAGGPYASRAGGGAAPVQRRGARGCAPLRARGLAGALTCTVARRSPAQARSTTPTPRTQPRRTSGWSTWRAASGAQPRGRALRCNATRCVRALQPG